MSTRRCFDPQALRIRVNMSAIGSVMLMCVSYSSRIRGRGGMNCLAIWLSGRLCLPARLAHAGDHPRQRQLAEANAAEPEATQKRARTAAPAAAVVLAYLELRLPLALLDHGLTSHCKL